MKKKKHHKILIISLWIFVFCLMVGVFALGKSIFYQEIAGEQNLQISYIFPSIVNAKEIEALSDAEVFSEFPQLSEGFQAIGFGIASDEEMLEQGEAIKKTASKTAGQIDNTYEIPGLKITTNYQKKGEITWDGYQSIKQTVTVENQLARDRTINLTLRNHINTDKVIWDNKGYIIIDQPIIFEGYTDQSKTRLTFATKDAIPSQALYDWQDVANLNYQVKVYKQAGQSLIDLVIQGIEIEANSVRIIDPVYTVQVEETGYNLEELEIKEVAPEKFAFKTLDGAIIEIGTESHSPPQPYLKLSKWDNEVSLKVKIPYDVIGKPKMVGGKLRYTVQGAKDIDFYPRQPEEITEIDKFGNEQKFIQNEQGGTEFDIILYEKPESNKFVSPIETKGLKYYYQPPLNQEKQEEGIICTETTCWDEDGNVTTYRPENVVGSYAVYHETKRDHIIGQTNYMTGKAFHIYRPKIIDSVGNWTWGELNIDEEAGTLTITIDQSWLDNAVYPVTIDPNFGYETIGGSSAAFGADYIRGAKKSYTGVAGTGDSMTIYALNSGDNVKLALYDASDSSLVGSTEAIALGASAAWYTGNFLSSPPLSAIEYWLVFCSDAEVTAYYDNNAADMRYQAYAYADLWPNPASFLTSTADRDFSIYATYTPAPSNNTPDASSVSDSPDPVTVGSNVTFSGSWTESDAGDDVKMYVCKDSSCTNCNNSSQSNCWCYSSAFQTEPDVSDTCTYAAQSGDAGSNNYWLGVCDDEPSCDASPLSGGTFTVHQPSRSILKAFRLQFKGGRLQIQ